MDLMLDGNAVAGLLDEIFAGEMTTAMGTCANCGAIAPLGAVFVYMQAPAVVMRCPYCGSVLIRIATRSGTHCVELAGVSALELRVSA
jgi:DNA-directed RNA polymerase subunit RPC12/RpoP